MKRLVRLNLIWLGKMYMEIYSVYGIVFIGTHGNASCFSLMMYVRCGFT